MRAFLDGRGWVLKLGVGARAGQIEIEIKDRGKDLGFPRNKACCFSYLLNITHILRVKCRRKFDNDGLKESQGRAAGYDAPLPVVDGARSRKAPAPRGSSYRRWWMACHTVSFLTRS
jgi:hypothetical protein